MASVFDLFKQTPAPAAQTTPVASAQGNPTVPTDQTVPTPTAATTGTDSAATSPMDKYSKLWETDPNVKPTAPFSFNSDPTKLMDTAKTVDFTKVVSPEVMKRIQAGGTDAQAALMDAMNTMSQLSFAQSSHAAAKITESALQAQEQRFKDMLPNLIKQHSVADSFRNDNPLLQDPAMAPMVQALQQQFTTKYPQATASEIKSHVNDFLNGAADRIQATRPKPVEAAKRGEEDWSKFFNQ